MSPFNILLLLLFALKSSLTHAFVPDNAYRFRYCPSAPSNTTMFVTGETETAFVHFSLATNDGAMSWHEGKAYCARLCMDMVAIRSMGDWRMVEELFQISECLEDFDH